MIPLPSGTKIWLVAGITDMRNGFNGLAAKVQTALKDDPMSGHVFIFRGRSGSQVKLLWSTGDGLCLLTKRLERGRFAWPSARDGKVFLTQAQLAMLLEGIDWRQPKRLLTSLNRPGFPGEYFICELRLPDHYFRWKHNKLFLLLPEEYGPAFPAIVDCYTSPPTLVWPVPLLSGFSSSYGVLPPLCKDH